MANTFSQAYAHIIFSTKGRQPLLDKMWRADLFAYMAELVNDRNQKAIIINGVSDHVHMLIGFRPEVQLSALVRDVKRCSSVFVKQKKWVKGQFAWQSGYGLFTHSHAQLDLVYKYIQNQEQHHRTRTFEEEYVSFLNKYNIQYDMRYVFD